MPENNEPQVDERERFVLVGTIPSDCRHIAVTVNSNGGCHTTLVDGEHAGETHSTPSCVTPETLVLINEGQKLIGQLALGDELTLPNHGVPGIVAWGGGGRIPPQQTLGRGLVSPFAHIDDCPAHFIPAVPREGFIAHELDEDYLLNVLKLDLRNVKRTEGDLYDQLETHGHWTFPSREVRNQAISHLTYLINEVSIFHLGDVLTRINRAFQIYIDALGHDRRCRMNPHATARAVAYAMSLARTMDSIAGMDILRTSPIFGVLAERNFTPSLKCRRFVELMRTIEYREGDECMSTERWLNALMHVASSNRHTLSKLLTQLEHCKSVAVYQVFHALGLDEVPMIWCLEKIPLPMLQGWAARQLRGLDFYRYGKRFDNCLNGMKRAMAIRGAAVYFVIEMGSDVKGFIAFENNHMVFWSPENRSEEGPLTEHLFAPIKEAIAKVERTDPVLIAEQQKDKETLIAMNGHHFNPEMVLLNFLEAQGLTV